MKLEKRINIINGVLMSGFMAFVLSGFFSLINIGFSLIWVYAWIKGFAMAWPLSWFLVFLVGPRIRQWSVHLATKMERSPVSKTS